MERAQFRALYREFLFRLVDLEILSERADTTKLLGQIAAMLAAASLMLTGGAFRLTRLPLPAEQVLITAWPEEHSLIAITMVAVGLFTVLCWDSTFPDRRDILILGPLPLRPRTMFLAKVAALGTALSMTIVTVGFGFTLSRRPIASASATLAPVLGAMSLAFGLWYAAAAWALAPYPF